MRPHIPIALGAGLISAVVFASAATGPMIARMALLALVSLPIALAGYSYNAKTALLAASVGTLVLALVTSLAAACVYALTIGFPAALLVYLALLCRRDGCEETHWYPIGRVVLVCSLMAGSVVAAGLRLAGDDTDKLRAAVRKSVEQAVGAGFAGMPGGAPWGEAELAHATGIMMQLLPGVSATYWMACILFCQWLAARVALASGQLTRPWPDLAAFRLPLGTAGLLGLAIAAALVLDGMPRLMAMSFAGVLYAVYVVLGLAIIHFITRGSSFRGGMLAAVYVVLIVLNSAASLLLALVGLADSFLPLRRLPVDPHSPDSNQTKP